MYMWGKLVGDIKRYNIKMNSTAWREKQYTECRYIIEESVYQEIISNGYMQEPNLFINKGLVTSMISKMYLNVEARGTQKA